MQDNLKQLAKILCGNNFEDCLNRFGLPNEKDEYLKNVAALEKMFPFYVGQYLSFSNSVLNSYDVLANKTLNDNFFILINGKLIYCTEKNGVFSTFRTNEYKFENTENVYQNDIFSYAANNFSENGLCLNINSNEKLEFSVFNFLYGTKNDETAVSQAKNLVKIVGNGNVVIKYYTINYNENSAFQNSFTEILVDENANLDFHIYENLNQKSALVSTVEINAKQNSNVKCSTTVLGGKNIQNILNVNLLEENISFVAPGIVMPSTDERFANLTFINHKTKNCQSLQKYRCIAKENGISDFYGIVSVEKNAVKTVAEQTNNNILLSREARCYSKPQLEIYAGDVKCSHGSTTGMLDQNALFYMQSRGISLKTAQSLLISAFAGDVISLIGDELYSDFVKNEIDKKLNN